MSTPQKRFYYRNQRAEIDRSIRWNHANRDKTAAAARVRRSREDIKIRHAVARRRLKYGLSPAEFDRLYQAQDGCCAICCVVMTGSGPAKLCVDHDHSTNVVRGLLCARCNLLLGKAQDNPLILCAAMHYLQGRS